MGGAEKPKESVVGAVAGYKQATPNGVSDLQNAAVAWIHGDHLESGTPAPVQ